MIRLNLTYQQRLELLLALEQQIIVYEKLGWYDRIGLLVDIQVQLDLVPNEETWHDANKTKRLLRFAPTPSLGAMSLSGLIA